MGIFFRNLNFGRVFMADEKEIVIEWGGAGFAPGEECRRIGDINALLDVLSASEEGAIIPHTLLGARSGSSRFDLSALTYTLEADTIAWKASRVAFELALSMPRGRPFPRLPAPTGPQWDTLRSWLRQEDVRYETARSDCKNGASVSVSCVAGGDDDVAEEAEGGASLPRAGDCFMDSVTDGETEEEEMERVTMEAVVMSIQELRARFTLALPVVFDRLLEEARPPRRV
ncbi:hypothetical protein IAT38_003350 [Cryptococcus sp. DSM 104549]